MHLWLRAIAYSRSGTCKIHRNTILLFWNFTATYSTPYIMMLCQAIDKLIMYLHINRVIWCWTGNCKVPGFMIGAVIIKVSISASSCALFTAGKSEIHHEINHYLKSIITQVCKCSVSWQCCSIISKQYV